MQVVLLILFSMIAYAEKCDPVEAEKQCYSLLCQNTPKRLIPIDSNELAKAFLAHPYTMPEDVSHNIETLGRLSDKIKESTKKKIQNGEMDKIAEDILKTPLKSIALLEAFFQGDLNCVMDNGSCRLIATDLDEYPEGMKSLYKKLSEDMFIFTDNTSLSMGAKKEQLINALEKLEGRISKDEIKKEKKKISKFKTEADYIIYSMDAKWFEIYQNKIAEDIAGAKNDLAEGLKVRMNKLMNIDLSGENVKNRMKRSCQLASYMKTTLNENGSEVKFNEDVARVIESFKTKFLSKVSEKTASELAKRLTPETFNLIREDQNIYPAHPLLGIHKNGYQEPEKATDFLLDLTLLDKGQDYKCKLNSRLVSDRFMPGDQSIFISQYVLANNFTDVITHELGHWFSHQYKHKKLSSHSSKKIKNVRKCVVDFYPAEKAAGNFKGDRFRTEEDFADWFSAVAGVGDQAMWCDLKKMVSSNVQDNFTPHKGDSHSNFLFRELVIRLNRGEVIPEVCKDLIGVYPDLEPKRCDL